MKRTHKNPTGSSASSDNCVECIIGGDIGTDPPKFVVLDAQRLQTNSPTLLLQTSGQDEETPLPGVTDRPLREWSGVLGKWIGDKIPGGKLCGLGISIAARFVDGQIFPTEKLTQFAKLNIQSAVEELRSKGLKAAVIHDGIAQLLGELAGDGREFSDKTVGMVSFGGSIAYGAMVGKTHLIHPYSPWPSHIRIIPDECLDLPKCGRCFQRGCWRNLYAQLKGDRDNARIERVDELIEITASGIATILAIVPMHTLWIGGGWAEHFLDPMRCITPLREFGGFQKLLSKIRQRLPFLEIAETIRLGIRGRFGAAIGAALHAWQTKSN